MDSDLVTVVIPAYNAERTIDATIRSVRAQSHSSLEVLVVDDGSTDATRDIVRRHAAEDSRVRLIKQTNQGVAAARNRGIAEGRADLVAPLDADDLWRPDKIKRQAAVMRAGGAEVGLVYCWCATIDEHDRVISECHRPLEEGKVFSRLCRGNLVGNGSSALIRKRALVETGGFDPSLRALDAGGCEDLKLYLQIAERYEFRVVKEFLTGYRRTADNMSSDWTRMFRSFDIVAREFEARLPGSVQGFRAGRVVALRFLLIRSLKSFQVFACMAIAKAMLANDWRFSLKVLAMLPFQMIANRFVRPSQARFPYGNGAVFSGALAQVAPAQTSADS